MFLGITPVSSVSNGLYFLTLPLVSVMRVIKRNIEKVWGARYLYIIRDAEKFAVRIIHQVRVIYRKIRYIYLFHIPPEDSQ
jgi:hypothetical protein